MHDRKNKLVNLYSTLWEEFWEEFRKVLQEFPNEKYTITLWYNVHVHSLHFLWNTIYATDIKLLDSS